MPWVIDNMGLDAEKEAIQLDPISERYRKQTTEYHVMLKTLQQARFEGIWKPCLRYLYRWGDKVFVTDRGSESNMGLALDVGVFNISPRHRNPLGRQRYYIFKSADNRLFPSRRVRELENGSLLASIGFPNNQLINVEGKSRDQLGAVYRTVNTDNSISRVPAVIFVRQSDERNLPELDLFLMKNESK
jgi:hypothetical protein